MTLPKPRVTLHMAASLDGFIARTDGRVDWMETTDDFTGGVTMEPGAVEAFLATIDCYVMGSHTYETALTFDAQGQGWAYGDTPTVVLTHRALPRPHASVEFFAGDLADLFAVQLRPKYRHIWVAGGSSVAAECLRLGLIDEVRYTILPVLIGDGIPFFGQLSRDVALHLTEVTPYRSGMVELTYEVRGPVHTGPNGVVGPG